MEPDRLCVLAGALTWASLTWFVAAAAATGVVSPWRLVAHVVGPPAMALGVSGAAALAAASPAFQGATAATATAVAVCWLFPATLVAAECRNGRSFADAALVTYLAGFLAGSLMFFAALGVASLCR